MIGIHRWSLKTEGEASSIDHRDLYAIVDDERMGLGTGDSKSYINGLSPTISYLPCQSANLGKSRKPKLLN